jgi:uncharacterized protein (TIGR00369 family)
VVAKGCQVRRHDAIGRRAIIAFSAPMIAMTYFGNTIPFLDLIGIEAVQMRPGEVEVRIPFRPELVNSNGFMHGGLLMSALDFAMASVARSADPERIIVSTIDMTTSFLIGAKGEITVRATCLRQGRTVAFCEAQALDAEGRLVAKASGQFSVRVKGG